jgi:asparaginyl-tRNA synthetase
MTINPRHVYLLTATVLANLRKALAQHSFTEILPALLSRRNEPGARHSIAVLGDRKMPTVNNGAAPAPTTVVQGQRWYYLPVSHAVEKQLSLEFLDRVYCVAPCIRLLMEGEDRSGKHLNTFFQVEVEMRTTELAEAMQLAETVLATAAADMVRHGPDRELFNPEAGRNLRSLLRTPYERITFAQAKRLVGAAAMEERDLTHDEERILCRKFDRPFWIYHYPEGVRDSLYRLNEEGLYDTYDLMLPFEHGELATGGVRADSAGEVLRQSRRLTSRSPAEEEKFTVEYALWKERTRVQSAGFGIGLERLVKFCAGAHSVLDIRPFHDSGPNTELPARAASAGLCDELEEGRFLTTRDVAVQKYPDVFYGEAG